MINVQCLYYTRTVQRLHMPKRIDWEALKQDYLLSEFVDVQEWGRSKKGEITVKGSGFFGRKTKGWKTEKEGLKKEQTKLTVEKVIEERSTDLANLLGDVYDHIKQNKEMLFSEGAKGLKTIWEIAMVANGLPTSISKNENTNRNVEEEKKVLESLVNVAKNAEPARKKK